MLRPLLLLAINRNVLHGLSEADELYHELRKQLWRPNKQINGEVYDRPWLDIELWVGRVLGVPFSKVFTTL